MPTIAQLQQQINDIQLQINAIETDLVSGKCSLADPRGEQTKLMLKQQQLMQQQASGVDTLPGANTENKSITPSELSGTDGPTGINRPPPPIPTQQPPSSSSQSKSSQPHSNQSNQSYKLCLSHQIPPICNFSREINAASQATQVPADLIGAVIYKESQGNPSLVSGRPTSAHRSAGIALGLMQVEPNTSPEIEAKHPEIDQLDGAAYDIMLGAWRLADLAQQFDGWDTVLRAYNSGAWAPVLKDPNAPITTGDPKYVYLVNEWWTRLSCGKQLPPSMNPAD